MSSETDMTAKSPPKDLMMDQAYKALIAQLRDAWKCRLRQSAKR